MAIVLLCVMALYSGFAFTEFQCRRIDDRFWTIRSLPCFSCQADRHGLVVYLMSYTGWDHHGCLEANLGLVPSRPLINIDSLFVFVIITAEHLWGQDSRTDRVAYLFQSELGVPHAEQTKSRLVV